ncbi:transketolase [Microbacter margulisiae]|uniref:Transketolase n=1 Tax=Microbacter margulisiae TaxID=1350067 RepID=A0A7W5DRH3_9PORP|nr:transketolase [Microbacter margulisiae]MBB3187209.1 transketolase [Microbacter margulisiae]
MKIKERIDDHPQKTEDFAKSIRKLTLQMVFNAKASHIGGALSMVDILAVLYNEILSLDPSNPSNPARDRFLLSKGHACTSLYATLALKQFFPIEDLNTYSKNDSIYLSHTSHYVSGIEISAGSLGHALPVSCGLALAAKRKHELWQVYCLISDGELDEGSNWESILFAPQHKLDNLNVIVDYNKIQSLGNTNDVIALEPLQLKFKAFNWDVIEIDGHNHAEIFNAFTREKIEGVPRVIIANTIKGKGISFMENNLLWHYKSPSEEQYNEAIKELEIR